MSDKDTFFSNNSQPMVMGILNVTPDSFFDGGKYSNENSVLHQTDKMLQEGAKIIDVGGYSSRPDSTDISIEEEVQRIQNAIPSIKKEFPEALISVDTFRSEVARVAIEEGATIVNDISGGSLDPKMFELVSSYKNEISYILMHMKGTPQTMKSKCQYRNLISDIHSYFLQKVQQLNQLGFENIVLDLGFGFAKTVEQNYELLRNIHYFKKMNLPILAGVSRKSMIYKPLGITANEALNGTSVLNTIALNEGAKILRVHDVKEAVETIKLYNYTYAPTS